MKKLKLPRIKLTQKGLIKITKTTISSILIVLTVFVGTGLIFLFNPFGTKSAEAAWFDENWGYRQEVPATSTNGSAQSNVFISFTLDTATLITAGKIQSSCQDIRVTDVGGNILAYHIGRTNACNNAATTIDALVPSFPDLKSTYYVYYGNPQAASYDAGAFSQSQASNYSVGGLGSEAKAPQPVAYWKFDEGTGTATKDATSNAYNGTLSGATVPVWKTEDQCISGKCLFFDGSTSYIDMGASGKAASLTNTFSVSAWIKPTTLSGTERIIATARTNSSNGWAFGTSNAGLIFTTYGVKDYISSTISLSTNTWYFVEAVMNGSNAVTFYVNGKAYDTVTHGSPGTANTDDNLYIGAGTASLSSTKQELFPGTIDGVKVYNYVRSAAQVQADYNARGNPQGAAQVLGASSNQPNTLSNGLVGYWKMDESSWTNNCSTTSVTDSSGNAKNLQSCSNGNGPSTPVVGKYGNAADFSGTNSYFALSSSGLNSTRFSFSFWMNADNAGDTGAYEQTIALGSGNQTFEFNWRSQNGGSWPKTCESRQVADSSFKLAQISSTMNTGTWYFVTCTYDGTNLRAYLNGKLESETAASDPWTSSGTFAIGGTAGGGNYFNGRMDEVRVYNRALSNSEVSQLYNFAPGPVGYWNFENGTGTSVSDTSGNGKTGSWNGSGTTRWQPGKYGTAGNFNGTDDYVSVASPNLPTLDFTYSTWVYPTTSSGFRSLIEGRDAQFEFFFNNTNTVSAYVNGANRVTTASTVPINTWTYVTLTRSGSTIRVYFNGVPDANTGSNGTAIDYSTCALWFGADVDNSCGNPPDNGWLVGKMDEVKIYNYARTQGQIIEDMNGNHPAPGSPVGTPLGYWKFDEGAANTCVGGTNDYCNYGNLGSTEDLAANTASWTNSGKIGKAWNGTGSIWGSTTNDTSLDFTATDNFTISMWFKSDSTTNPSSQEWLVSNGNSSLGYAIYGKSTTGLICFGTDDDVSSFPEDEACSTADLYDTNWHYLTAIKTGTSKIELYIDQQLVGSKTSLSATGTLVADGSFLIGDKDGTSNGSEYTGDLDEIKIYASALTTDQIKLDANQGKAQVLGALGNNSNYAPGAANQEYCVPGDATSCVAPVGRWDFEEGSGTSANDTSGNANTGTITPGTGGYTRAKDSKGYRFDAADTVVSAGSGSTIDNIFDSGGTIEAWIYPKSVGEAASGGRILGKVDSGSGNGWLTTLTAASGNTSKINFNLNFTNSPQWTSTNTVINFNQWNHIVITYNSDSTGNDPIFYINGLSVAVTEGNVPSGTRLSDAANNLLMGNSVNSDRTFDGIIDQVRLFDYTRTPAQVAWDYNQGEPVAYWRMDDCQGTSIKDSSLNQITGTLTLGGGGQTVTGTCTDNANTPWYNGRTGKYNASLNFDGASDYVAVPTSTAIDQEQGSVTAWVKTSANGVVFAEGSSLGPSPYYMLLIESGFAGNYQSDSTGRCKGNITITDGNWHFIAWTQTGAASGFKVYTDGVENTVACTEGSNDGKWFADKAGDQFSIGVLNRPSPFSYFTGQIDELRVYNNALTITQIKQIMNNQAATRYGPATGTP